MTFSLSNTGDGGVSTFEKVRLALLRNSMRPVSGDYNRTGTTDAEGNKVDLCYCFPDM